VILAQQVAKNRPGEALNLAGNGLTDMLRLAGSDFRIWEGVLAANVHHLVPGLETLIEDLRQLKQELETGQSEALQHRFTQANEIAAFHKKIIGSRYA
jgi:prephenate dehydrogenase